MKLNTNKLFVLKKQPLPQKKKIYPDYSVMVWKSDILRGHLSSESSQRPDEPRGLYRDSREVF